jgi:hypothetical protein
VFLLAIHVDGEGEIFAGFEEVDFFLEEEGVGAEVDVFFTLDEAFDDFFDVRVKQRFTAGDGDHGSAAFIDGFEALLGGELLFEDVGGVLDFAAAGTGEVAAEEGLEHEDEGVALDAAELLGEDVGGDGVHLRDGYWHKAPGERNFHFLGWARIAREVREDIITVLG